MDSKICIKGLEHLVLDFASFKKLMDIFQSHHVNLGL